MPKNSTMMPLFDVGIIKHKDGTETRIVPQGNGFVYPYEDALVIKQTKQMLKAKYIKEADFKKLVHKCYENDDDTSYNELKKFNHKNVVDKHGFEYKIYLADDLGYTSENKAYKLKHVMNPSIYKRNKDYLKVKRSDN